MATDGAAAFRDGHFKEAVDLFSKAESLMHAPPHLLFLARAEAKLGQFVRAREAYLKITNERLASNAPQAFHDAQTAAADEVSSVEPHIGRLTVNVEGSDAAKDLNVTVDGQPVSAVLLGVPQPTDPGVHRVTASAAGFKTVNTSVTLKDAERQSVTLKLVLDSSAVSATPAVTAPAPDARAANQPAPIVPPPSSTSDGSNGMRIGAYVAAGVGVVGLGLGTVFGLTSKGKRSDADAANAELHCPCRKDDPQAQKVAGLDDDARKAQTLSIVGFVVGGVGIATGVTLFVLSNKHEEKSAFIAPYIGLGAAGFRGAF